MAKKSTAIDVTQGVIWQQLLSLCVPIFFSSFFQQAYTLIGTYIVGQFGGKLALGGIQATMVLTELCIGFCVGVGAGCAVITGQYFGQHDDERLSRSVHTAMTLALVGGIVFSILGIVFVEPMLVLMNTPHELLAEGVAYARCYFAAMVAALLLNMGTALLRAVGDTRGPAVIIASGCLVNAVLDVIFVAVLHMEALGCGIAVALTICSNATMIVIRMMHAPGAWRLSLSKLGIDPGICKSMISCGLPLGFQSAAFMLIGGLSAVLLVFSGPLSRLFVDDASISAYTTTILHFIAPFYAIFSIIENASGSIRGAGVSLQPMLLTIFGTVVLRVIWVFAIMPFDPSLEHLLLVYPVTWLITATMFTIYHHSGNWLGRATA